MRLSRARLKAPTSGFTSRIPANQPKLSRYDSTLSRLIPGLDSFAAKRSVGIARSRESVLPYCPASSLINSGHASPQSCLIPEGRHQQRALYSIQSILWLDRPYRTDQGVQVAPLSRSMAKEVLSNSSWYAQERWIECRSKRTRRRRSCYRPYPGKTFTHILLILLTKFIQG